MTLFDQPVTEYMSRNVAVVRLEASLNEVARRLGERRISSVPVVDADGGVVGVISRTDLLHAGRMHAGSRRGTAALVLPDRLAEDLVRRAPLSCGPDTSLRDAARTMREHRVHRLFVVEERRPVGVISTLDLTRAVRDARVEQPLSTIMTAPLVTVNARATLAAVDAQLDHAHVSGLVVVDDEDWPVGMFSQKEALESRDLPRETLVDDVLDPSIICMRTVSLIHHAAAQASHLDVRRVIVCAHREPVGMVSGLDFARVVAA